MTSLCTQKVKSVPFLGKHNLCSNASHMRLQGKRTCAMPFDGSDVVVWAEKAFEDLVLDSRRKPKELFSLEKACMIVSVEEEAAVAAMIDGESINGHNEYHRRDRGIGIRSSSTWNLERIDALAMECAAKFYCLAAEAGVTEGLASIVHKKATDSALLTMYIDVVKRYPMIMISAINEVIFDRHGYRRMRSHGNPRDASLASLLEVGEGCPGALAVLYMAIAERVGLKLFARSFDSGRFFAVWPQDPEINLRIGQERVVIDPYGEGTLITETELKMLFSDDWDWNTEDENFEDPLRLESARQQISISCSTGNSNDESDKTMHDMSPNSFSTADTPTDARDCSKDQFLRPQTVAEILAGVLEPMKDAYWCSSIGCSPEPAFMTPIGTDVALKKFTDLTVDYVFEGDDASFIGDVHDDDDDDESLTLGLRDGDGGLVDRSLHQGSTDDVHDSSHPWPIQGFALRRALAIAKKRQILLPDDPQAALETGLFFYFLNSWGEAWLELGVAVSLAEDQGVWSNDRLADARKIADVALVRHQLSCLHTS